MNFTTATGRGTSCVRALSRQYSVARRDQHSSPVASSSTTLSHTTLPPAKMRALIALYHQADSWITPENLAEKIDKAFVPMRSTKQNIADPTLSSAFQQRVLLTDLQKAKHNMDVAPKFAQYDRNQSVEAGAGSTNWARSGSKRENKVIEALYGLSTSSTGDLFPNFQVVQEAVEAGLLNKEDFTMEEDNFSEIQEEKVQETGQSS